MKTSDIRVVRDGISYFLDLNEYIDNLIEREGYFERGVTKIIKKYIRKGMVVLDIGAHIGCHTLRIAKLVGKEGKVIAFEPMSYPLSKLELNVKLNDLDNVKLEKLALSNVNERKKVNFTNSWPINHKLKPEATKQEEIDFITLDEYVKINKIDRIDFIKLDVDGYEYKVICGGINSITAFKPLMVIELGRDTLKKLGDCVEDLINVLISLGYSFLSERNLIPYQNKESLLDSVSKHEGNINVLCVPEPINSMKIRLKKVLILVDEYGWAFDFVSRGIMKHSTTYNYTVKRWNEVDSRDQDFDVVFAFNYDTWWRTGSRQQWLGRATKCIGVRSNSPDPRTIKTASSFDAIGCNSLKTYDMLKNIYPDADNVYFTPNGIDTDIFQPTPRSGKNFKLGWAGAAEHPFKRVHLARQLDYPIRVMCRRYGKYFTRGASRKPMQKFYANIDCLVHTSNVEGMTSVAIEAASCGLPIVATDVGDMSQLVEAEWLVPIEPDDVVVREMNKRLEILKNDVALRHRVGKRNRREILENWDWRHRVAGYEEMFRGALEK